MSQVTVDAAVAMTLMAGGQPVEVCDKDGRVIGRFTPDQAAKWWPFTDEQVEQAKRREGPYRTLEDLYREHGPK